MKKETFILEDQINRIYELSIGFISTHLDGY
jgi:hypothetical protein